MVTLNKCVYFHFRYVFIQLKTYCFYADNMTYTQSTVYGVFMAVFQHFETVFGRKIIALYALYNVICYCIIATEI